MSSFGYTQSDLDRFKEAQKLAYDCVTDIEQRLEAGMTERDAAKLMYRYLSEHGVREYFHKPFVWFGDRTAFEGFRYDVQFFPTGRRLAWGTPVILDVAPILDGYAADIGYSCCFGENALHARMQSDLRFYRDLILEGVKNGRTLRAIYEDVDALIAEQGYVSRHRRYPGAVLAHRVTRLPPGPLGRLTLGGFGVPALRWLSGEVRAFRRGAQAHGPFWNGDRRSEIRATAGLWAVEPHIGCKGVGAKWEELLVVTDDDAYWLDDDLPHVRRWKMSPAEQPAAAASS